MSFAGGDFSKAYMPEDDGRRYQSSQPMDAADPVPELFPAEIVKAVAGQHQEGVKSDENGPGKPVAAQLPPAPDMAAQQGAQDDQKQHRRRAVRPQRPGFERVSLRPEFGFTDAKIMKTQPERTAQKQDPESAVKPGPVMRAQADGITSHGQND